MTDNNIVRVKVLSVDPSIYSATVELAPGVTTNVYPQDGALPDVGQTISCTRNGGDLVPVASSQRAYGTFRGALEASSFVGTSKDRMDVWAGQWTWTPSANTTVAQPTEGVDDALMRLTRTGSTGRVQAQATIPVGERRYIAAELSAPAASATGRDCYMRVDFLTAGVAVETHLYHLDNLYVDPRSVASEPLRPPTGTTHIKFVVYSESTTLTAGQFMEVRLRAWDVPVFQGGAVLDLEGNVQMDHRGLIVDGYPITEEPRVIPIVHGVSIFNFPLAVGANSLYTYKPLGPKCEIAFTFYSAGAAVPSTSMTFILPFPARVDHVFNAAYEDIGVRWHSGFATVAAGSDVCTLHHTGAGNAGNTNQDNPFTFGTGDKIIITGDYPVEP